MCLFDYKKLKLEEPLTVYKVVVKTCDGYVSPYHSYPWEIGKTEICEGPVDMCYNKYGFELTGGAFHTYKYLEDAIWHLRIFSFGSKLEYAVGKFTIPTDAEVYFGKASIGEWSYASTMLTMEEEVVISAEDINAVSRYRCFVKYNTCGWPKDKEQAEEVKMAAEKYAMTSSDLNDTDKENVISNINKISEEYYRYKGWQ